MHPLDEWQMTANEVESVCYRQPKTLGERLLIANDFVKRFRYPLPLAVDAMDDRVEKIYAGWPELHTEGGRPARKRRASCRTPRFRGKAAGQDARQVRAGRPRSSEARQQLLVDALQFAHVSRVFVDRLPDFLRRDGVSRDAACTRIIVDRNGVIVYKGEPGPFGFHPEEVEAWLTANG